MLLLGVSQIREQPQSMFRTLVRSHKYVGLLGRIGYNAGQHFWAKIRGNIKSVIFFVNIDE